jgi:hypothetical protein
MALTIKVKRATRAQLNSAASSNQLIQGEPYLITDEDVIAIGTSTSTYEEYSKGSHVHSNVVPTGEGEKHGFMSHQDKAKLDGVAANANAYSLPVAGAALGGVKADTKGAGDTVEAKIDGVTEKLFVPTYPTVPEKAIGTELDTGTDDAKFATAKAIKDSKNVPYVAPSTVGKVMRSDGTDWTSANIAAGDLPTILTPTTIELGHASDTTLSRGAAGFLAVEGKRVPSPASQAAGDMLYRGTNDWDRLAKGTSGHFLKQGATNPGWSALAAGDLPATLTPTSIELGHASDTTLSRGAAGYIAVEGNRVPSPPSQAEGDILYRGATEWARLAKGTALQTLRMNSGATAPEWATATGLSWVTAPESKNSSGTAGQVAYDTNYFYICTATNTWKRSPIATNW